MATPKKKGKGRVKAKKKDPGHKTINTYAAKEHRYAVTFRTGVPAFYESPELMAKEINEYFEYIKGEAGERIVKVGSKIIKEQYWIREPEPPTITGMCLYLKFAALQSLDDYMKKGPGFAEVIKAGKLRIANKYERNLSGNNPTGSIFYLKVQGWREGYLLPNEGEGVVIGFQYIVPTKPKDDE